MPASREMTAADLAAARPIADEIIRIVTGHTPPAAVAGVALALAALTHLAHCGPKAAQNLFDHYYRAIDGALTDATAMIVAQAAGKED
jgi:hypothetical protein